MNQHTHSKMLWEITHSQTMMQPADSGMPGVPPPNCQEGSPIQAAARALGRHWTPLASSALASESTESSFSTAKCSEDVCEVVAEAVPPAEIAKATAVAATAMTKTMARAGSRTRKGSSFVRDEQSCVRKHTHDSPCKPGSLELFRGQFQRVRKVGVDKIEDLGAAGSHSIGIDDENAPSLIEGLEADAFQ